MKSYILLRDNRESGPYTIKELREYGLSASDLIWVEGESTSWNYPSEISGLKSIVNQGIKKPLPTQLNQTVSVFSSENDNGHSNTEQHQAFSNDIDPHLNEAGKFSFSQSYAKRRSYSISTNFFGLGVLLIGAMFCALVVKKMVDHFDYEYVASAQAVEIKSENLPLSVASHQAKASNDLVQSELINAASVNEDSINKAAVKNDLAITKAKLPVSAPLIAAMTTENVEKQTETQSSEQKTQLQEQPAEKEKEQPVVEPTEKRRPTLQVSANEYKVGVFGGISDLQLQVNNPSDLNVNKAVVEVEFLKPNGSVINTNKLTIENISPGGSKTITVPSSNRGVKVRYRIVDVDA